MADDRPSDEPPLGAPFDVDGDDDWFTRTLPASQRMHHVYIFADIMPMAMTISAEIFVD